MPESNRIAPDAWPSDFSIAELVKFASKEFPTALLCFVAATRKQDNAGMLLQIGIMRHVVTRIDQYRRMKVKQWNAAAPANSNQETPPV